MTADLVLLTVTLLLAWSYIFYPALAFTVASILEKQKTINDKRKTINDKPPDPLPSVSVIMSIHNEETVIAEKMQSLADTDYPAELIEFLVGSDASTDATDSIMIDLAAKDNRIRYYGFSTRRGKPAVLNSLAREAKGTYLIITDANVMFSRETVRMLISGFSDTTGLCDATVSPSSDSVTGITRQENLYSRFETSLKRAEGMAWGAMTGPYGGCYAVRRELFPVIPENTLVDDLYAGLTVIRKGYGSVNIAGARVTEDTEPDIAGQYRRRVRIAAGSFQNLFRFGPFPSRKIKVSFAFFSHKVIRWFTPLLLAIFFMTTVILSGGSVFYFCLLSVQLIFIILSALDLVLNSHGRKLKILRYVTQFLLMNAALTAGFVKAVRGIKNGIWEPTKRIKDDGKHNAEYYQ
jgi:cellulose synthase/poly-beta-1,6-N-acetylglucosamine synthase-like glycosyltransferase